MRAACRGAAPKLAVPLGLVLVVLVHQLSFLDYRGLVDLAPASPRVEACRPGPDADGPDAIPRLVHQLWKTANASSYAAGASRDAWRAALELLNYTARLWTDDVARLVSARYAWLRPTLDGYARDIQRADVARLVVVHAEGGVYADLDVYPASAPAPACLRRLGLDAVFAPTAGARGLSNHFFLARRGAPVLQWALREARRRAAAPSRRILLPYLCVFWSTGPLMLTAAVRSYARAVADPALGVLSEPLARAVVRHEAGRSWHGSDGCLLNYLGDHAHVAWPWGAALSLVAVLALLCVVVRRARARWPAPRRDTGSP